MKPFITTFKLLASIGCLFLTFALAAQPQLEQWSLPPYLVDFTPGPSSALLPVADYSGQIPSHVSNSMYDENGNLLFFIVDYEVFDANGMLIDYLQLGSNFITPGSEIAIVPKPASCTEFYIIGSYRNTLGTAWIPFYTLLDISLPNIYSTGNFGALIYFGSNTTVFDLSTLAPPKAFDEPLLPNSERNRFGLAITPFRQSTNDYFAFMKGFNPLNLYRYVINASGIVFDATAPDLGVLTLPSNIQIGGDGGSNDIYPEMEIVDLQNSFYRIAGIVGKNKILISNILYNNGMYVPATTKEATLPFVQNFSDQFVGLEFTPDGNHLFYTYRKVDASGSLVSEHIGTVNLTNATIVPVDMSNSQFQGANTLGFSFIERGHDNKMYFNDGGSLYLLDFPYAILSIYWGSPVLYGSSFPLLPDQLDGQDYQAILELCDSCCTDSTAFFIAAQNVQGNEALGDCFITVVGSGLSPCMQITWNFGDGPGSVFGPFPDLTQASYTYSTPGIYTVCYLVQEFDANGNPCWEYERCTEVEILCTTCCTDSLAFIAAAEQINPVTAINKCELSYTMGGLSDCMQVTYFWGDGNSTGPILFNNTPVSHTYMKSGVYVPCWKIEEVDGDSACWEFVVCDTIEIICDTCYCKDTAFTDLVLHWDKGPGLPIQCETAYDGIPCPKPGKGYFLTGKFECVGDSCESDSIITWSLEDPLGNVHVGNARVFPFFIIGFLPVYTSTPGIYTMTMTGHCGADTCTCSFQFVIDCANPCPCEKEDVADFQSNVSTGYSQIVYSNSCRGCFSPLSLSECDRADWYLNSTTGSFLGSSTGNQAFCYDFPGPGTYNLIMHATRYRPDGTVCVSQTHMQNITILCSSAPTCNNSILRNSTFDEGAIEGSILSGGTTEGWNNVSGDPDIIGEPLPGSHDGWAVYLSGNLDTADVISSVESICLAKSSGNISLRLFGDPIPGRDIKMGIPFRGRPGIIHVVLYTGGQFGFDFSETQAFEATVNLPFAPDSAGWFDIHVPYDLRNLVDSCGISAAEVRLAVFIRSELESSQGGFESRGAILVDELCINGELVEVDQAESAFDFKIYPNPTTMALTVMLPEIIPQQITLRVVNVTGRIVQQHSLDSYETRQTISIEKLSTGLYFLEISVDGKPWSISRFMKL